MDRFNRLFDSLKESAPNMNIKYKDESWLMKALATILFFVKDFDSRFTTTLPITDSIYFSNRESVESDPKSAMMTLTHEWKHIRDSHKYTAPIYILMYLAPQILALSIIPLWFFVGYWSLLALIFLGPLPSFGRMFIERRGYVMSLFAYNELLKEYNISEENRLAYLKLFVEQADEQNFKGPNYYFMWPFGVKNYLDKAVKQITSGDILDSDEDFKIVKEALTKSKNH